MLMPVHETRLAALRQELKRRDLDGFVVPISDEHMSEYVGAYAQRLEWLTGFRGSAGSAIALANTAAIFVDGRYTAQVRDQVDERLFTPVAAHDTKPSAWLAQAAPDGARIGYDPWLATRDWVEQMERALDGRDVTLVAVSDNPLDAVWTDRPARPDAPLSVHPAEFAGEAHGEKLARVAEELRAHHVDAAVIAALDSVAWIFNLRGADVANTPVTLAFAIVRSDGTASLFVDPAKLTDEVRLHLGNAVELRDYRDFAAALAELAGERVAVDPERAVAAVPQALESAGASVVPLREPPVLMKAIKNEVERAGARAAHLRDGAALTRFLRWISQEALKGGQDELTAAARLRRFREDTGELRDLSFRTISATGGHGALPHYSVDEASNAPILPGQLYLVDSGGHYRDGTTDITRVVAIGEPSEEMRRRYTQVLKGHIALARAIFPEGTSGGQLDILARQYLWAEGVDYAHGTGHGVGSYLSVHEGPARIATFGGFAEPLRPGMILSNEPGYYKEGAFGIRIENLVLVEERDVPGAERRMLGFETISFAPLDRHLIDPALLSEEERLWVDDYHRQVVDRIGPQLSEEERSWLEEACAPL